MAVGTCRRGVHTLGKRGSVDALPVLCFNVRVTMAAGCGNVCAAHLRSWVGTLAHLVAAVTVRTGRSSAVACMNGFCVHAVLVGGDERTGRTHRCTDIGIVKMAFQACPVDAGVRHQGAIRLDRHDLVFTVAVNAARSTLKARSDCFAVIGCHELHEDALMAAGTGLHGILLLLCHWKIRDPPHGMGQMAFRARTNTFGGAGVHAVNALAEIDELVLTVTRCAFDFLDSFRVRDVGGTEPHMAADALKISMGRCGKGGRVDVQRNRLPSSFHRH